MLSNGPPSAYISESQNVKQLLEEALVWGASLRLEPKLTLTCGPSNYYGAQTYYTHTFYYFGMNFYTGHLLHKRNLAGIILCNWAPS